MTGATSTAKVLGALDRDIVRVEREVQQLSDQLNGLRSLREGVAGVVLNGAARFNGNGGVSRTAAMTKILQDSKEPVGVDDILAALREQGRNDEKRFVYSTLGYLARKNVAKSVERGKWVAVTTRKKLAAKAA